VFGSCGFLSFSLVFCLLGGRLGTTLYIHFIRRWVKARRHSSAPREKKNEKKAERYATLRSWRFCGVCLSAGRARPAGHLSLLHVLDQPSLAERVYRLSDGGDGAPPRFCAGRRGRDDAFHHLRGAYFGEYVQPTPRKVEGEAEKPHASVLAQVCGYCLY